LTSSASLIVQLSKEHPIWGAPKIREKLGRMHMQDFE
jgi:hypothetical protein